MLTRSCVASSTTAVNRKSNALSNLCLWSLDRFIKDTREDRASRSFMTRRDQFGRRIFVRMCNNFQNAFCILSPVYSRSRTTPRHVRHVYICIWRGYYCSVESTLRYPFVSCCSGTRNAGKLTGICKYRNFDSEWWESSLLVGAVWMLLLL